MDCPLGFKEKEWCLDCKFQKQGLCDWPHKIIVGDNDDERGTTAAA